MAVSSQPPFNDPNDLQLKPFRGKTRTSLPVVLDRDIKELHKSKPNSIEMTKFENIEALYLARTLAKYREKWKKIVQIIC